MCLSHLAWKCREMLWRNDHALAWLKSWIVMAPFLTDNSDRHYVKICSSIATKNEREWGRIADVCRYLGGGGGKRGVCRQELEGVHLFVVMDSSNLLDWAVGMALAFLLVLAVCHVWTSCYGKCRSIMTNSDSQWSCSPEPSLLVHNVLNLCVLLPGELTEIPWIV